MTEQTTPAQDQAVAAPAPTGKPVKKAAVKKAAPAKGADTKKATTKKAAPAKPAPAVKKAPKEKGDISPNQIKILEALKGGKPLTRKELADKLGISKGFSKMLGAVSKDDYGAAGQSGLCAKGYVIADRGEEDRVSSYKITPAGKAALEKAKKAGK